VIPLENKKKTVAATAFILSAALSMLPFPYSNGGVFLFFVGFIGLIVVGHRAAFRQHKHGFVAQYTAPKVFLGMSLNGFELVVFLVCAGLASGFLFGVTCKQFF